MLKDSKTPMTSERAVFCLGCIGPKAQAAVPALVELLNGADATKTLWETTIIALQQIAPEVLKTNGVSAGHE